MQSTVSEEIVISHNTNQRDQHLRGWPGSRQATDGVVHDSKAVRGDAVKSTPRLVTISTGLALSASRLPRIAALHLECEPERAGSLEGIEDRKSLSVVHYSLVSANNTLNS
jgi:hypothetical protein